MKGLQF